MRKTTEIKSLKQQENCAIIERKQKKRLDKRKQEDKQMDFLQRMQQNTPYCSRYTDMPSQLQQKAKTLCWL